MTSARKVSADVLPLAVDHRVGCFACSTANSKKPSLQVTLSPSQIAARASVDTQDVENPFIRLESSAESNIFLFTACVDKNMGCNVISKPRTFWKRAPIRALQLWKTRCATEVQMKVKKTAASTPR